MALWTSGNRRAVRSSCTRMSSCRSSNTRYICMQTNTQAFTGKELTEIQPCTYHSITPLLWQIILKVLIFVHRISCAHRNVYLEVADTPPSVTLLLMNGLGIKIIQAHTQMFWLWHTLHKLGNKQLTNWVTDHHMSQLATKWLFDNWQLHKMNIFSTIFNNHWYCDAECESLNYYYSVVNVMNFQIASSDNLSLTMLPMGTSTTSRCMVNVAYNEADKYWLKWYRKPTLPGTKTPKLEYQQIAGSNSILEHCHTYWTLNGAMVMLLHNIHVDPARGHFNGTRYIVRHIRRWYITVRIASSEYSGDVLLLPRKPLSQTDAGVVPLDNLCLTGINSPRSKYNACVAMKFVNDDDDKATTAPRDCGFSTQ